MGSKRWLVMDCYYWGTKDGVGKKRKMGKGGFPGVFSVVIPWGHLVDLIDPVVDSDPSFCWAFFCHACQAMEVRGSPQPTALTHLDVVKRPYGLNHKGFHVITAFYCLEDDVGKCLVCEGQRVRKEKGSQNNEQESVANVTSVGVICGTECADIRPVNKPSTPDAMLPSIVELGLNLLDTNA
ncbi:hypothetical protein CDL15_Pgr005058 [Punica granatum]|uniref:Uncharacterized protein n=1 Tax=Punica granatum TaxID=22663 RepID=A0A218W306_PUNGR|nr:hypothetical protein CDL15_Pgr005058 [Punica granatum]